MINREVDRRSLRLPHPSAADPRNGDTSCGSGSGCELTFEFSQTMPTMMLNVHFSRFSDLERPDHLVMNFSVPIEGDRYNFGNSCSRLVAPVGRFSLGTVGARETIVANNAAHNCLKLACISERGIHKVAVRIPGVIVPCADSEFEFQAGCTKRFSRNLRKRTATENFPARNIIVRVDSHSMESLNEAASGRHDRILVIRSRRLRNAGNR